MARGDRARQRVVVGARPAEVRRGGPDDHRGVGDPAGDHDVGAGTQAIDDAPRPEISVGRQRRAEPEFLGPRQRSSPSTWATLTSRPEPLGQLAHRDGQPGGVEPARVGDDPHAPVQCGAQAVLELREERLGIAAVGRLRAVAGEDQHGQLGEIVAGEVVQVAAREHLAHRRQPVSVEARAVADADRTVTQAPIHCGPNQPVG